MVLSTQITKTISEYECFNCKTKYKDRQKAENCCKQLPENCKHKYKLQEYTLINTYKNKSYGNVFLLKVSKIDNSNRNNRHDMDDNTYMYIDTGRQKCILCGNIICNKIK